MNRREFLSTPLVTAAMTGSAALAQETPRYDTVLKGGHVIDLANQINQQMDVAVLDNVMLRAEYQYIGMASYQGLSTAVSSFRVGAGVKY